jgi:hypothetical protein
LAQFSRAVDGNGTLRAGFNVNYISLVRENLSGIAGIAMLLAVRP